ncbi:hypothetical protein C725_1893 [Pacificimonas flava]|uniref:Uncharacterized protein n=1 Tax=Pacificimonas flava TaxID=1234595 RepID=M2U4G9_9SPHN|nr:hypothetical protein C725_1893 [Pacificimonas flava]
MHRPISNLGLRCGGSGQSHAGYRCRHGSRPQEHTDEPGVPGLPRSNHRNPPKP